MPADRRPGLELSIQITPQAGDCPADRAQLRRWVRGALRADARLVLRLVGETEARALNTTYRGRRYVPNVLTFAYGAPAAGEALQADVVVCLPVALREARAQRKRPRDHLGHLVVHGVLHAQGLDHERDEDARAMQALETAILHRFGIGDPYRIR